MRCVDRFVIGNYDCPCQIGNRMFVMLNAAICASVFDAHLIWETNHENPFPHTCDRYLDRQVLTRESSLDNILKQCPNISQPPPSYKIAKTPHIPSLRLPNVRNATINYCGRIERPIFPNIARRSRLTELSQSKIDQFFDDTPLTVYGRAFFSMFKFNENLRLNVDRLLGGIQDNMIGVHVRNMHRNARTMRKRTRFIANTILARFDACTVFVASDDASVLTLMRELLHNRCAVSFFDRTYETPQRAYSDHGNFAGDTFMKEIYALSKTSVFFGTLDSSASELIASIVLAQDEQKNTAYLCSSQFCRAVR